MKSWFRADASSHLTALSCHMVVMTAKEPNGLIDWHIWQWISWRDIGQSTCLRRLTLGAELFAFAGEAEFRRSPSVFCFPLWRPSDLFNKLVEYWLTVNGHIGTGVFFFYPPPFFLTHCCYFTCVTDEKDDLLCHHEMLWIGPKIQRVSDEVSSVNGLPLWYLVSDGRQWAPHTHMEGKSIGERWQ